MASLFLRLSLDRCRTTVRHTASTRTPSHWPWRWLPSTTPSWRCPEVGGSPVTSRQSPWRTSESLMEGWMDGRTGERSGAREREPREEKKSILQMLGPPLTAPLVLVLLLVLLLPSPPQPIGTRTAGTSPSCSSVKTWSTTENGSANPPKRDLKILPKTHLTKESNQTPP